MNLKVEIAQEEIHTLLTEAVAKRIGKPVEGVTLVVKQKQDFRGDPCGYEVSAVAFIGEGRT